MKTFTIRRGDEIDVHNHLVNDDTHVEEGDQAVVEDQLVYEGLLLLNMQ